MKFRLVANCLFSLALSVTYTAHAANSKTSDDPAKIAATERYADDRKLCAEETNSAARMQCLRDARAEYDRVLAAAKKTANPPSPLAQSATPSCSECGKVLGIRIVEKKGDSTPLGMIAGGVAGALLGHQVGNGRGKDLATIAGAAGGAYAGHKIEQNVRGSKTWVVTVGFESAGQREFSFEQDPGFVAGDLVKSTQAGLIRR